MCIYIYVYLAGQTAESNSTEYNFKSLDSSQIVVKPLKSKNINSFCITNLAIVHRYLWVLLPKKTQKISQISFFFIFIY